MSSLVLENTWTFWNSNMRGDPDIKFLSQFTSIQEFWDQFKSMPVSALPDKTYLHVFKDDIKPLWEDARNYSGGHFKLTAKSPEQSETMWLSVLLNMLGEQFPHSELVNGASVMSNQVGNNLVKVWLSSTDKTKVQATRDFLHTILNAADYMANVTFVPHKLVVKGAGKKVSNRITEAPLNLLAGALPSNVSDSGSRRGSEGAASSEAESPSAAEHNYGAQPSGYQGFRRRMCTELVITAPASGVTTRPCNSPAPPSPESTVSFGLCSFGGALSSIPSSRCSEYSSTPPSPRPISPAASYTGSEWEADCGLSGMKLMPPSPAYPFIPHRRAPQHRSWSVTSQDYSYTHNPYSLANSVIYSSA